MSFFIPKSLPPPFSLSINRIYSRTHLKEEITNLKEEIKKATRVFPIPTQTE